MATIEEYAAPTTLAEVLQALAERNATVLAGGTDILPRWARGLTMPPAAVVSLRRVTDLKGVERNGAEVRVGACTRMSEIASDAIIAAAAPVLACAAGRVACAQIRNRATIGGNLCNASPAADTAIPLLLLDAVLDVASFGPGGTVVREVPIADFFRGPGATVVGPGELLTHIRFKPLPQGAFAAWDKFGTRPAMEIAVASVGLALRFDGETRNALLTEQWHPITWARVGYGSVAPVPLRGRRAEAQLVGKPLSADTIDKCVAAAREEIAPITDVRASAGYRREVVGVMLRRMLERAQRARKG
jgi:CO/xanthine dehydrogenase FAD-binding subunit